MSEKWVIKNKVIDKCNWWTNKMLLNIITNKIM